MIDQRLLAAADAQIDVLRAQSAWFSDSGVHSSIPPFVLTIRVHSCAHNVNAETLFAIRVPPLRKERAARVTRPPQTTHSYGCFGTLTVGGSTTITVAFSTEQSARPNFTSMF